MNGKEPSIRINYNHLKAKLFSVSRLFFVLLSSLLRCLLRLLGYDSLSVGNKEVNRLLADDVLLNILNINPFLDLLNIKLICVCHFLELSLGLLIGCLNLLKLCNLLNRKLELDLLNGVVPHARLKLVSVHAHILKICVKRNTLLCKSVLVVLNIVLKLVVVHNLGDLTLNKLNNLLKNCALEVSLNVLFLLFGKLRLDFLLEFGKSLDLVVNILCKVIVKSRKLLILIS